MLSFGRFSFVLLIVGLAAAAAAVDTPPNPTTHPAAVPAGTSAVSEVGPAGSHPAMQEPTAGMPSIPENQAEIEALRSGTLVLEPVPNIAVDSGQDAVRDVRRAAFDAVMAGQDAKIQALNARLGGSPGAEVEIQQEIAREKRNTTRLLLELQLEFAVSDGNEEQIARIQSELEGWDAPLPTPVPSDRPVPVNPGR